MIHLSWIWLGTHSGRETKGQLKSVLGTHLVQGSDLDTPVLMHINRTAFSFRFLSRRVNQQLAFPDMVPGRTTFAKWLAVSANVKCEWVRREWTKHACYFRNKTRGRRDTQRAKQTTKDRQHAYVDGRERVFCEVINHVSNSIITGGQNSKRVL